MPRKTAVTASPSPPAASAPAVACFSRGSDSPVSAASLTNRSRVERSRPSAGTRSPALRWITSPTTTSRTGTSRSTPSRITVAVWPTCRRRRAAARCERYACVKFRATLSTSISAMITALTGWPNAAETTLATSRISTSGLAK